MKVKSESEIPSVMSDSSRPHRLQPTRLLCPWDSPGKSTGIGCHCLLQFSSYHDVFHDPDNQDGVITHLEPNILECEVKWALESLTMNKASGADGISVELFQTLKDDAVKMLHSICQKIWKTQQWPKDWTRSIFIRIPKKRNAKECSNYCTIALISHTSKVMLKILQARLQ